MAPFYTVIFCYNTSVHIEQGCSGVGPSAVVRELLKRMHFEQKLISKEDAKILYDDFNDNEKSEKYESIWQREFNINNVKMSIIAVLTDLDLSQKPNQSLKGRM